MGKRIVSDRTATKRDSAKKRPAGRPAETKLAELRRRLAEVSDLNYAGAVLGWDQATYMPPGGAAARARQVATLSRLAHEKLTDPELGRLLDSLARLCREPAARLRRRGADPRDAARLRQGDARAGRLRGALERASAPPPTMPGRGRGRPTTSPPCAPTWRRRSTSAASTPTTWAPTSTSPTR